ncbi:sensor domain-containing diguanylate cyclase [Planctomycetota bacterium]|nr:sensor domain-containing diguanylate cyclase [Planctomycetota bacterium]
MSRHDSFPRRILDQFTDGAYVVDRDRRITFWSKGAERITGYKADQVLGHHCYQNILMHVNDCGTCLCKGDCPLKQTIDDGIVRNGIVYLHHQKGHRIPVNVHTNPIRDHNGHIVGGIEIFSDESAQNIDKQKLKALEAAALLDPLTNLANRRHITENIEARFAELSRNDWNFGIIFIDVDHFKQFNDMHGHSVGDRILQLISRTMKHSCRTYDMVGRWGGEEFIIIIGHTDEEEMRITAERVRALVSQSFILHDDDRLVVTISAGVTMARQNDSTETLINRADSLLYQSKENGRNRVTCDTQNEPKTVAA